MLAIQNLGPKAKVLAFYGGVVVMAAILIGLGAASLWRRWSAPAIAAVALALFLVAMGGLMPLTGGGVFGTALPHHVLLGNGVFACIALAYATVLLAGRAWPVRVGDAAAPLLAAPPRSRTAT